MGTTLALLEVSDKIAHLSRGEFWLYGSFTAAFCCLLVFVGLRRTGAGLAVLWLAGFAFEAATYTVWSGTGTMAGIAESFLLEQGPGYLHHMLAASAVTLCLVVSTLARTRPPGGSEVADGCARSNGEPGTAAE